MNKPFPKPGIIIALIILMCFTSRIPQLVSPYLFLDGDECIIGVMAKHIYEGKELPLYFWGQHYGFSLVECLFIIPFYAVLGVTTLSVKLAMLSLWTIGVLFLYKSLVVFAKQNSVLPLLLIMLFIWHPAWAVWSMKARGGYLTAFTLTNITIYLLFHPRYSKNIWIYGIGGLFVILVYESQRFWLSGLLPLMLYKLLKEKSPSKVVAFISGVFLMFLFFYWYKHISVATSVAGISMPDAAGVMERVLRLPYYLYASFHGNYYFQFIHTPDGVCAFLAIVFSFLISYLFIMAVYRLFNKPKKHLLFIVSVAYFPLCYCFTLLFWEVHGRYLLPLSGFMFISLQIYLRELPLRKPVSITVSGIAFLGFIAMISFRNFEFLEGRKKLINNIVQYYKTEQVQYVYSLDAMLSWELVFYSDEKIITHMPGCDSRYQPYNIVVNNAYMSGRKTALIFRHWEGNSYHLANPVRKGMYITGVNPVYNDLKGDFCLP